MPHRCQDILLSALISYPKHIQALHQTSIACFDIIPLGRESRHIRFKGDLKQASAVSRMLVHMTLGGHVTNLGGIRTPFSCCLRLLACLDTWISSSHESDSCFLYGDGELRMASQAIVTWKLKGHVNIILQLLHCLVWYCS